MTTIICCNRVLASDTLHTIIPRKPNIFQHFGRKSDGKLEEVSGLHYTASKIQFDSGSGGIYDQPYDFVYACSGNVFIDMSRFIGCITSHVRAHTEGPVSSAILRKSLFRLMKISDGRNWEDADTLLLHRDGTALLLTQNETQYAVLSTPADNFSNTHDGILSTGSGAIYRDMVLPYVDITDPLAAVHIATLCSKLDTYSGGDIQYVTAGECPEIPADVKTDFDERLQKATDSDYRQLIYDEISLYRKCHQKLDPMVMRTFTVAQQEEYIEKVGFDFNYVCANTTSI